LLPEILADFIQKVLTGIGEHAMSLKRKPFCCDKCGNNEELIWKTRHGKETKILTVFQSVKLLQLQVQCKVCGHKFYITRKLLGIEPKKRIPADTYRKLGLMGSLTTYRVAEKIVKMFGWSVDKMTVWKSVQRTAQEIELNLAPFGRAFDAGIFHGLVVTTGTTKNRHKHFSSLEFSVTKLEIDDRLVDPYLTAAHGTAVVVFLRRGAKGNILPLL
jgi:hypothetical protein